MTLHMKIGENTTGSVVTHHNGMTMILTTIAFSACLSGVANSFYTALYIAIYEIIFILSLSGKKTSWHSFFKNRVFIILFFGWATLVSLSLLQLFLKETEMVQLMTACFRYCFIILHIVFALCAADYFRRAPKTAPSILKTVPYSVVVITGVYAFTLITAFPSAGYPFAENPPLATNVRHLGFIASVGAVIACIFLLEGRTLRSCSLWAILSLINLSFLLWLGGRTAIGSALISILVAIMVQFYFGRYRGSNLLLLFVVSIISLWLASISAVFDWNLSLLNTEHNVSLNTAIDTGTTSINHFSSGRLELWAIAIEDTMKSFWLGLGPDGYRYIEDHSNAIQPHNLFVQIFVEWGLLGSISFIALYTYCVAKAVIITLSKQTAYDVGSLISLAAIITLSLHSLTDGTFYHAQPLFIMAVAAAILLGTVNQFKNKA